MGWVQGLRRLCFDAEGGAFDDVFHRRNPVQLDLETLELRLRAQGYLVRRSASRLILSVGPVEDVDPPLGVVIVTHPVHGCRLHPKWESRTTSLQEATISRAFVFLGRLVSSVTVALLTSGLLMEMGVGQTVALSVGPVAVVATAVAWVATIDRHRRLRADAFYRSVAGEMPAECSKHSGHAVAPTVSTGG